MTICNCSEKGSKMSILTLETNKYALKLENFEGPLDLLIHLIDKNKMDIYDVNLSEITDQYIEYINQSTQQTDTIIIKIYIQILILIFSFSKSTCLS